jgi:hypothetical protein
VAESVEWGPWAGKSRPLVDLPDARRRPVADEASHSRLAMVDRTHSQSRSLSPSGWLRHNEGVQSILWAVQASPAAG